MITSTTYDHATETVTIEHDGTTHRMGLGLLERAARQADRELAAAYRPAWEEALRQRRRAERAAEQRDLEERRRAALARIRACTDHRVVSTSEPRAYVGAVARHPYAHENRAAHGGIEVVDTCDCGARRRRLVNGCHEERGPWGLPRDLA